MEIDEGVSAYRFGIIRKWIALSHHFPINYCCSIDIVNWQLQLNHSAIHRLELLLLFLGQIKSFHFMEDLSKIMSLILSLIGGFEPCRFLCFFDHLKIHPICLFSSLDNFDKLMKIDYLQIKRYEIFQYQHNLRECLKNIYDNGFNSSNEMVRSLLMLTNNYYRLLFVPWWKAIERRREQYLTLRWYLSIISIIQNQIPLIIIAFNDRCLG
jgi:hypothetical protein